MTLPRAHIQMTRAGHGRVTLDGIELPGVRSVEVHHEVGQLPRVVVEIIAREAPIEYVDSLDDEQEVTTDGTA